MFTPPANDGGSARILAQAEPQPGAPVDQPARATGGQVLVDGTDVRDYDLASYRHQLGIVPQESYLFAGTVRDSIAYARPDASDAEVEAAARATGAHDMIIRLAGGYAHEVAERGRNLSAGQRQLIALARAQLADPAILLLDEATAALDLAAEAAVNHAISELTAARTTIVVAHRLTTLGRNGAKGIPFFMLRVDDRVGTIGGDDPALPVARSDRGVVLQAVERAFGGGDRFDAEALEQGAGAEGWRLQRGVDLLAGGRHRVRDLAHHREVVRDEQVGRVALGLQLHQQVEEVEHIASVQGARVGRHQRRQVGLADQRDAMLHDRLAGLGERGDRLAELAQVIRVARECAA